MSEGKCEDCGKPTTKRQDGTYWKKCYDCGTKAKEQKATEPQQTPQQAIAYIGTTFQIAIGQAHSAYIELMEIMRKERGSSTKPVVPAEDEARAIWEAAMHLNNQFWKNDRTPR